MTTEQQAFLEELENDLAASDPARQLGIGDRDHLTIADATEALSQTVLLISQLPIESERKGQLIQKTQDAYQNLLLILSDRPRAVEGSTRAVTRETPALGVNSFAAMSAGKILLSLLGGALGVIWSIPRFGITGTGLSSAPGVPNLLAFVIGWAFVWVGQSYVESLSKQKSSPDSRDGAWLATILGLWMCLVATHQTWSAMRYADWLSSSAYDARARVFNDGLWDFNGMGGGSYWGANLSLLGLASFVLNCFVCVVVDRLLAAGGVRGFQRFAIGVGIVIGVPILFWQAWEATKGGHYDSRLAMFNSAAVALCVFVIGPIAVMVWGEKRGVVSGIQARLTQFLAAVSVGTMLLALAFNPFSPFSTVKSRLPDLSEKVPKVGDWLYELSLKGSGTPELIRLDEAEREEALSSLLEKLDSVASIRWPDHAQPFDYNPDGDGTWYRDSAVKKMRAKGITGPVRK